MSVAGISSLFTFESLGYKPSEASSKDSIAVGQAIKGILLPKEPANSSHSLTDEELDQVTARFIASIKNDSIDLAQFFPKDKIEEGRRLLQEFAVKHEAEKAESKRQREEDLRELAKLESEVDECTLIIENCDRKIEEADRKIEEARRKKAEARRKIEEADIKIAEADIKLAEERTKRPLRLAKGFYNIFKKGDLSPEEAQAIFDTYLADGGLTTEEDAEGRPFSQIHSMNAIITFFTRHPEMGITALDFRHFKDGVDARTIAELIVLLKSPPGVSIKAVAFKDFISSDAKALLEGLKVSPERAGYPLKIVYAP